MRDTSGDRDMLRPDRRGCNEGWWLRRHDWRHSHRWNAWVIIPGGPPSESGVSRSGWRCFHCGKFVWDQTDLEFALTHYFSTNRVRFVAEEVNRTGREET